MQSKEPQSDPLCLNLSDLHPFPSIYAGLTPEEQMKFGRTLQSSIQQQVEQLQVTGLSHTQMSNLIQAAQNASQQDIRDSLHAMRYGAAVAIVDCSAGTTTGSTDPPQIYIVQAPQIKALEYGCTLDAACQLASQILVNKKARPVAVVLVDQFGIPHGLFAQARAFFVEHGFGDCMVIVTRVDSTSSQAPEKKATVQCVPARELAPFVPEFRS
eukprot:Sro2119_g315370.2  (213) ;mRNA; r:11800-12438